MVFEIGSSISETHSHNDPNDPIDFFFAKGNENYLDSIRFMIGLQEQQQSISIEETKLIECLWKGIEPTGKTFRIPEADGKLLREDVYFDSAILLKELGGFSL